MKTMVRVLLAWAALGVSAPASAAPPVCPKHADCVAVLDGMVSSGAGAMAIAGGDIVKCCVRRFDQAAIF